MVSEKGETVPKALDIPGFVYVHERNVTRTETTSPGGAHLTSNTTGARIYPLDIRCRLELLVERVVEPFDPGHVSLETTKHLIQHASAGPSMNRTI
jgi:hypothetical protein